MTIYRIYNDSTEVRREDICEGCNIFADNSEPRILATFTDETEAIAYFDANHMGDTFVRHVTRDIYQVWESYLTEEIVDEDGDFLDFVGVLRVSEMKKLGEE